MSKIPPNHRNLSIKEVADLLHVSSSTIHNWVKEGFLELDENHNVTSESLGAFQLKHVGKNKLHARANKLQKDNHDPQQVSQQVQDLLLGPEKTSLGDRYEAMLSESYKNKEGISYTPDAVVDDMMKNQVVDAHTMFLDPCCGSGNFLIKAIEMGAQPQNVYGFDTDPNAVLIARHRIKALTGYDSPKVVCADFLQECPRLTQQFDLVFTNPPWGKKLPHSLRMHHARQFKAGSSNDTCSLFLFAVLSVLCSNGTAGLLMPESFYNIAVYEDARKAVLGKTILGIKDYGKVFKNMYSAVSILFKQQEIKKENLVLCQCGLHTHARLQNSFKQMPRCNLNYWTTTEEMELITDLMKAPSLRLKGHVTWGMGIVTGNNASLCKHSRSKGLKPVYRGKDLLPGRLKAAELFINPNDFPQYQQMAPLELYHAKEKLIYRFISNKLVFVCDTRQRYILNSANMLVLDEKFPLSAKQLTKIMNSPLSNWLFKQLFHTHKVLRSDLELLPVITDSSLHRRFNLLNLNRQALK